MMLSEEISGFIHQKHYRKINSVLFWQDGEILAENYYNGFTAQSRNVLNSVVKSILSLAAGVALDRGLLPGLDVAVADYIPALQEGRDPLHPLITLRHPLPLPNDGAAAAQRGLALPYCRLRSRGSAGDAP